MATKSAEILALRPTVETISQAQLKVPTTGFVRIASLAPAPIRWGLILSGVVAVFALLIGANYWASERWDASGAAPVPRPVDTPNNARSALRAPPQPFSGLSSSNSRPEPNIGVAPDPNQPPAFPLGQAVQPTPAAPPQSEAEHQPRYITVSQGQTLIRIAHANHVSAKAIAAANGLERPYRLMVGSQLLMPDPSQ